MLNNFEFNYKFILEQLVASSFYFTPKSYISNSDSWCGCEMIISTINVNTRYWSLFIVVWANHAVYKRKIQTWLYILLLMMYQYCYYHIHQPLIYTRCGQINMSQVLQVLDIFEFRIFHIFEFWWPTKVSIACSK